MKKFFALVALSGVFFWASCSTVNGSFEYYGKLPQFVVNMFDGHYCDGDCD